MNVRIGQSRDGSSPLEIERFRVGPGQSSDLVRRSSGNDTPAGTSQRFADGTIAGEGANFAAVQDEIGMG